MPSIIDPSRFGKEVGTRRYRAAAYLALGGVFGIAVGTFINAAMSGTPSGSVPEGAAAFAPTVPCELRTWPYVDNACSRARRETLSPTRQIRLISTDRNVPAMIVAPLPRVDEVAPPLPTTQRATASPAADGTNDQAPPPAPPEAASVQIAPAAQRLADRQLPAVRTITVRSDSGRRGAAGRVSQSRSVERTFIVPTENAIDAYAYAPR
jgi:hypothetical protein